MKPHPTPNRKEGHQMNHNTFNDSERPDEQDRLLDLRLAALPRFDPSPGFADRVMARVRIRRPAAAVLPWYARPWNIPAGIQRLAAALAVMAATSSAALTLWAASNLHTITETARRYATTAASSAAEESLRWFAQWASSLAESAAALASSTGWPATAAILTAGLATIPLSMLGLYLASRPPQYPRRASYARR